MSYSKTKLIKQIDAGAEVKFLFFWEHTNDTGEINASCLSQWYDASFKVEGNTYPTAEHWMMAEKARVFNDTEVLNQILQCEAPHKAKKLGRAVHNFDVATWDKHKYAIVIEGNRHKFGQNPALREFLLDTGNRILVEASPRDTIWGIGLGEAHRNAKNPSAWRGDNLLGFALMELRDGLGEQA